MQRTSNFKQAAHPGDVAVNVDNAAHGAHGDESDAGADEILRSAHNGLDSIDLAARVAEHMLRQLRPIDPQLVRHYQRA